MVADGVYDVEMGTIRELRELPPHLQRVHAQADALEGVWRTVAGYDTTDSHLLAFSAFQLAQCGHLFAASALALFASLAQFVVPNSLPVLLLLISEGWRHGKETPSLLPITWRPHWGEPIEPIRARTPSEPVQQESDTCPAVGHSAAGRGFRRVGGRPLPVGSRRRAGSAASKGAGGAGRSGTRFRGRYWALAWLEGDCGVGVPWSVCRPASRAVPSSLSAAASGTAARLRRRRFRVPRTWLGRIAASLPESASQGARHDCIRIATRPIPTSL